VCGITLFAQNNQAINKELLDKTAFSMAHRGPNGTNIQVLTSDSGVHYGLGHNLLQITDKNSVQKQPFSDNSGRYHLLFNGEIYNYEDLKNNEALDGYQFYTKSDTEVLLALLIHLRLDALKLIDGMFAFTLLDLETNTVISGRDYAGMKPLYYSNINGNLIITSELQAQAKALNGTATINESQIPQYLQFKYANAPQTLLKDVYEVLPSQYLIWQNGNLTLGEIEKVLHEKGDGHLVTPNAKAMFRSGLQNQMSTNHHNALLLSGGVDSTLILAFLQDLGVKDVKTYTAVPSSGTDADSEFAKLASEQFGGTHNAISYDSSLLQELESYASKLSAPIADPAGMLTWWITRNEVNPATVLLSGAGADELFCGYSRHQAFHLYLQFPRTFNNPVVKALLQLAGLVSGKAERMKYFLSSVTPNPAETFVNLTANGGWKPNDLVAKPTNVAPVSTANSLEDWLQFALNYDRSHYLVSDVLNVSDSAAMMNGKEIRLPYLNSYLYKYIAEKQATECIAHGRKWILKTWLKDFQGKVFIKRKKKGFGTDFTSLFQTPQNLAMAKALNTKGHWLHKYIKPEAIAKKVSSLENNKAGSAQSIFSLLLLDYWVKANSINC